MSEFLFKRPLICCVSALEGNPPHALPQWYTYQQVKNTKSWVELVIQNVDTTIKTKNFGNWVYVVWEYKDRSTPLRKNNDSTFGKKDVYCMVWILIYQLHPKPELFSTLTREKCSLMPEDSNCSQRNEVTFWGSRVKTIEVDLWFIQTF